MVGFSLDLICDSSLLGGCFMSSALSSELRTWFREYIEEGLSGQAAAARLKLSAATGGRWQRKWHEKGRSRRMFRVARQVIASFQRSESCLKNWLRRTVISL
jgi:transposase